MATSGLIRDGRAVGKWRASYLLARETFRFLRADKEILLVPVVTGVFEFFAFLALGLVALAAGITIPEGVETLESLPGEAIILIFVAYVIAAFAIAFSQGAVTHIVYTRAHGGDATLGEGLAASGSVIWSLFVWSLITSTVGIILRAVSERSRLLGRLLTSFLGAAWSILTYFAVPAMVIDKKSPVAAVKHSGEIFRRTWGESLIANIGLGAFFMMVLFLVIGVSACVFWLAFSSESLGLLFLAFFGFALVMIVFILIASALSAILRVLLYIYASEGTVPPNFDAELLAAVMKRQHQSGPPNLAVNTV